MFDFGSIKEIFLILGGVIVFLFVFYIVLVITSDTKKKGTTTTPQIKSNKCNDNKDCEGNKICSNGGDLYVLHGLQEKTVMNPCFQMMLCKILWVY